MIFSLIFLPFRILWWLLTVLTGTHKISSKRKAARRKASRSKTPTKKALKPRANRPDASRVRYKVSNFVVIDGDTIYCRDINNKVRIHGIDAPEMGQGRQGHLSKAQLEKLIRGRSLILEHHAIDVYNRMVAKIYIGSVFRRDVGQAMVASGYAVSRCKPYRADEIAARNVGAGLFKRGGDIKDPAAHRRRKAARRQAA